MNGRVQDPITGRFLSADPFIPDVEDTQSWNRYSYVNNNPLSFVDPSGFFFKKLFRKIKRFIKKYWRPILAIALAIVTYGAVSSAIAANAGSAAAAATTAATGSWAAGAGAYMSAYAAAAGAWSTAAIAGASAGAVAGAITGSLRGAVAGAVTGGLLGGIGGAYGNRWTAGRVVADGAASGIGSEIQGGSFADGFRLGAGFSLLRWGAYEMRQAMIRQSCTPASNPNCTGVSSGTNFDGDSPRKIGGGRLPWELRDRVQDIWKGVSESWLGGNQGQRGVAFGIGYEPGSFLDRVIESYAGPHDWMSSFRYGYHGTLIPYTTFGSAMYGVWSAVTIVPATPFAVATAIPTHAVVPASLRGR
jgi:hypothetical protein